MSNKKITPKIITRLTDERNIWMATMRPDCRPHLVPVWFVWHDEAIYLCIRPKSVKAKNLAQNPKISLSLEDGSNVVVCEGSAETIAPPHHPTVLSEFKRKYDWDITTDVDDSEHEGYIGYTLVLRITPEKWLIWGDD